MTKNISGANADRWRRLICRQTAIGLVRNTNLKQDQERHLGIGKSVRFKKKKKTFFFLLISTANYSMSRISSISPTPGKHLVLVFLFNVALIIFPLSLLAIKPMKMCPLSRYFHP